VNSKRARRETANRAFKKRRLFMIIIFFPLSAAAKS
jgi:hypothetical protein